MDLNTKYKQARDIVLSFLKDNKIDNVNTYASFTAVDVFKLGAELGFDIRGAFIPDSDVLGVLVVNEKECKIEGFNSNKVIVYNNYIPFEDSARAINLTNTIIAYELANYIFKKKVKKVDKLVMGDMYKQKRKRKNNMIFIIADTINNPLAYADSDIKINDALLSNKLSEDLLASSIKTLKHVKAGKEK